MDPISQYDATHTHVITLGASSYLVLIQFSVFYRMQHS